MSLVGASRRGTHAPKVETMPRMHVDPETGKLCYPMPKVKTPAAQAKAAKTTRETATTHTKTKIAGPGHNAAASHGVGGKVVYSKTFKTPKAETTWTIVHHAMARRYDPSIGSHTGPHPNVIEIVKGDARKTRETGKAKRYFLDDAGRCAYGNIPVTVLEAARIYQLGVRNGK
jgi:hypothetical protein